jgi:hypothetical protein
VVVVGAGLVVVERCIVAEKIVALVAGPGARPSGPEMGRRSRQRKRMASTASAVGGRWIEDGLLLREEGRTRCLTRCARQRKEQSSGVARW